jgi:CubicO group peptidase (beta-lactamase class C family)
MNSLKLEKSVIPMIERGIAEGKLCGAAVRVARNGETLLDGDIGVKSGALFRLASMTKPITAVAVLLEAERGRLRLDDPVNKYLPAYTEMYVGRVENGRAVPGHKAQNDIKILHLLTHTSGILCGEMGEEHFPETNSHRATLAEAVDYYPKTLLAFEPFTKESYSPLAAFDVAARIVELVSGMPYDEYLEKKIFSPIGITDTGFSLAPERRARFAPMHALDDSGHPCTVELSGTMGTLPDTYFCAGGGLAGSADDYAKFADMLRREGGGLLKPESVGMMRTAHWPGWGLGVRAVRNDRYLPDGCFGWSGAYGTHFWVDPSTNLYAVYMKNSLYDGGSGAKTAREFEKAVMEGLE